MRWAAGILFAVAVFAQNDDPQTAAATLINQRCVRCHGAGGVTLGGLDLTSAEGLAKGGMHGTAVVAGKPGESRLFQFAESGKMPQGGPRLSAKELSILRLWVEAGPKLPPAAAGGKRVYWAFRPPVKTSPPGNAGHLIDRFLNAKLEAKGLAMSPQAEHRTLIRRLYDTLTGLPPAPEDYAATFDQSVEKLLASPRYGERWGRHWLDVVRYGETDGGEHNYERPHAWRYRDYVIASINNDVPYDRFIREQIAGDLLAPGDARMTAATGFLTAGPWDQVSAELNKDAAMKAQARMDELDDMVTTTFHTFQALTVNCARCHDHKFDPIPTRDYYKLTAVFAGVGFGNRTVAPADEVARYDAAVKPLRAEQNAIRKQLESLEGPARDRLLEIRYRAFDKARVNEPLRLPLNPVWNRNTFAAQAASHFRMVIRQHRDNRARVERLRLLPGGPEVARWESAAKATDDAPVTLTISNPSRAAVAAIEWAGNPGVYALEASDDGSNWRPVASSLDHVGKNELDLPELPEAELLAALAPDAREERAKLLARQQELRDVIARTPEPTKVYGARPLADIAKSFVLERGSATRPREPVAPGALTAVAHRPEAFVNVESDRERRLALAGWIADPGNPLTARVIVNRVWYHHFGNGLVNTPSDFGAMGDRPSHPELLDWLAVSFMENGWSLKWLHRQILSTRAWKQSSKMNADAFAKDADNRLLWRMPLRRLDGESLRDAVLSVAGTLNLEMGGPGFLLQKKGDRGSYIYKTLDNDGPEVWRRAVYRFVVRGGERIMLDAFDCPDPSVATPQRSVSNTPVQALTLLNNEFVLRQAEMLAQRLAREAGAQPEAQIARAYQLLFGRAPSVKESEQGQLFIREHGSALYARVLLNTNEFNYVP